VVSGVFVRVGLSVTFGEAVGVVLVVKVDVGVGVKDLVAVNK
jgi:hypothetical protein